LVGTVLAETIVQGTRTLQEVVEAAAPYSVVECNPNTTQTISETVVLNRPVTLRGLNARLPDKLGNVPVLRVESEQVTITDFYLRGNADTVSQDRRAPLIEIRRGRFRIERGVLENSSKDGVMVSPKSGAGNLADGVVRDLVGRGVVRDVVSLSGDGTKGCRVRNILVENIRGFGSELRGTVEVSDGSENITVRKVYAENCVYAIDIQDHGQELQINRNIVIDDVYALNCRHAIRNANHDFGHANVSISNITAEQCERPLELSNTDRLSVRNIHIIDQTGTGDAIAVVNCHGVSIRDVTLTNGAAEGAGLLIENCGDILVDGVALLGKTPGLSCGVRYLLSKDETFSNLQIRGVTARDVRDAGILLESKRGVLSDYIVSGNIAQVTDRIQGDNRLVSDNLPNSQK
jgi:hypothetical protein